MILIGTTPLSLFLCALEIEGWDVDHELQSGEWYTSSLQPETVIKIRFRFRRDESRLVTSFTAHTPFVENMQAEVFIAYLSARSQATDEFRFEWKAPNSFEALWNREVPDVFLADDENEYLEAFRRQVEHGADFTHTCIHVLERFSLCAKLPKPFQPKRHPNPERLVDFCFLERAQNGTFH